MKVLVFNPHPEEEREKEEEQEKNMFPHLSSIGQSHFLLH